MFSGCMIVHKRFCCAVAIKIARAQFHQNFVVCTSFEVALEPSVTKHREVPAEKQHAVTFSFRMMETYDIYLCIRVFVDTKMWLRSIYRD